MNKCNYCAYKNIKKETKNNGTILSKVPAFYGGVDIFKHPKDISIESILEDKKLRETYYVAYFMEITKSCSC